MVFVAHSGRKELQVVVFGPKNRKRSKWSRQELRITKKHKHVRRMDVSGGLDAIACRSEVSFTAFPVDTWC